MRWSPNVAVFAEATRHEVGCGDRRFPARPRLARDNLRGGDLSDLGHRLEMVISAVDRRCDALGSPEVARRGRPESEAGEKWFAETVADRGGAVAGDVHL